MRESDYLNHHDAAGAARRLDDAREASAAVVRAFALLTLLSPRQRELVACLRCGLSVAQAAACMSIARGTAWGYWRRVRAKVARVAKDSGGGVAAPADLS